MFNLKKFFNSTILGLTLGVFLAAYAVFAFTSPAAAPPGGNVEAPVNVGSEPQVKVGGLWVGSLVTEGGAIFGGSIKIGEVVSLPSDCGTPGSAGKLVFFTIPNKFYSCDGSDWKPLTEGGIDNDGDGVTVPTDCDDDNVNIWRFIFGFKDADLDTFTTGSVQSVCSGDSLPSGWLPFANGDDCNDNDNGAWRFRFTDADGDTHCPNAATTCVGNQGGYIDSCTRTDDCNDGCGTCYVGSTLFTTTADGNDQNCNGQIDESTGRTDQKICPAFVPPPVAVTTGGAGAACLAWCGGQPDTGTVTGAGTGTGCWVDAMYTQYNFDTCIRSGSFAPCPHNGLDWSGPTTCTCRIIYR